MWAVHVLSLEGRPQGPVEWETDRARFLGRGRDTDRPGRARRARVVGHDGHRARPDLQPPPADQAGPGRVGAPLVSPPASPRIARRPKRWPRSTATRARPPAPSRSPSRTRRAACVISAFRATRRCCSSVWRRGCSSPTARCGRARTRLPSNELGQAGLWPHGISGDLPILLVRVVGDEDVAARASGASGAGVLAPEGAERRCRHPERGSLQLSGRDARAAHGAPRQRALADVETSVRRRLPPARRSDRQGASGR